jgi:hypothetical protein
MLLALVLFPFLSPLLAIPAPSWPTEFIAYSNTTRLGQVDDTGSQFYSTSNNAQRVDHSNLFNTNIEALTLWIGDQFHAITNNAQDCCIYKDFNFPMPNANWTDILEYTGNETIAGVDCYRYENNSIIQTIYWQSINDNTPVAWSNDPDGKGPIVQYFSSVSISSNPLPASLFTLPSSCQQASICLFDSINSNNDDDSNDSSSIYTTEVWIGITIVASLVSLAIGIEVAILYMQRKQKKGLSSSDDQSVNSSTDNSLHRIPTHIPFSSTDSI